MMGGMGMIYDVWWLTRGTLRSVFLKTVTERCVYTRKDIGEYKVLYNHSNERRCFLLKNSPALVFSIDWVRLSHRNNLIYIIVNSTVITV